MKIKGLIISPQNLLLDRLVQLPGAVGAETSAKHKEASSSCSWMLKLTNSHWPL